MDDKQWNDRTKEFLEFLKTLNEANEQRKAENDHKIKVIYSQLAKNAKEIKEAFMENGFTDEESFKFAYEITMRVVKSLDEK